MYRPTHQTLMICFGRILNLHRFTKVTRSKRLGQFFKIFDFFEEVGKFEETKSASIIFLIYYITRILYHRRIYRDYDENIDF